MFINEYLQRPLHDKRIITDNESLQIGDIRIEIEVDEIINRINETIFFKSPRSNKQFRNPATYWCTYTRGQRVSNFYNLIEPRGSGSVYGWDFYFRGPSGYYSGIVTASVEYGAGSSQGSHTEVLTTTLFSICNTDGYTYPVQQRADKSLIYMFYYENGQYLGQIPKPDWAQGSTYPTFYETSPMYKLSNPVLFTP